MKLKKFVKWWFIAQFNKWQTPQSSSWIWNFQIFMHKTLQNHHSNLWICSEFTTFNDRELQQFPYCFIVFATFKYKIAWKSLLGKWNIKNLNMSSVNDYFIRNLPDLLHSVESYWITKILLDSIRGKICLTLKPTKMLIKSINYKFACDRLDRATLNHKSAL